jgi:hypothetical protein
MTGKSRVYQLDQKKLFIFISWIGPEAACLDVLCRDIRKLPLITAHTVMRAMLPHLSQSNLPWSELGSSCWWWLRQIDMSALCGTCHSQPEISADMQQQPCRLAACVPCCPHGLQRNSRAGITALWCQTLSWSYWAYPGDSAPTALSSIIFCKQK